MNDKATKPFGLWLKGEAERHREASPCDLPWESGWPGVPQVHTHLPSPALHDSLMLQGHNKNHPQEWQLAAETWAGQQPQVLRFWEPRVHRYQRGPSVTSLWSHHQPQAQALCSQALLMTHWCCPRMVPLEQCHIPTTAASVTNDPQHLRRIHNLLPGFAGSFASCHFSSINLLPVREGNRTDPWGDGERWEKELNQVRTSSASPPHRQGPDVAAKLPFSDTVSELSLAKEK